nr:SEC-C metal-binding domain-containing protein [Tardiphaga sp. OK246]
MRPSAFAGLANEELEHIKAASLSLRRRRINDARAKGKIGRNEPCPCGSGKKYKRCHGQ